MSSIMYVSCCVQAVATDVAVPISRLTEIITLTKHDMQESGLFGNEFLCFTRQCTHVNGINIFFHCMLIAFC